MHSKLLIEERRRAILDALSEDGRVKVDVLAKLFHVSAVTIRNDLQALSSQGVLVRSYGGAMPPLTPVRDHPLELKKQINVAEKVRIARAAARLVQPHQTVILDSGSTSLRLAEELRRLQPEGLTVITHALPIALALAECPAIAVITIGGILRHISRSNVGPQAERMLSQLHADQLFLAVDGLDVESGFSTPDIFEAQLNSQMIEISREVTIIADSSKFGRRSLSKIGDLKSVSRIITDLAVPDAAATAIRERGIELQVV